MDEESFRKFQIKIILFYVKCVCPIIRCKEKDIDKLEIEFIEKFAPTLRKANNLILKLKLDNLGLTKEQYDGIIGQITSKIKSGQVKDAVALYESSFSESTEKAKEEVEKIAVENGCSSQYEEYKKKEDRNAYIVLGVVVLIIILIVQSC